MKKATKPAPIVGKPMFRPASMPVGFIILGFDGDPSKIRTTLNSITKWYGPANVVVAVPESRHEDWKGARIGGDSITSLINAGMTKPPADWNVVVLAGVHIKEKLDQRYSIFMQDRLDIFYPLVWGRANFLDAPINGLCFHRDTYKEVGPLGNNNSLELCKMMWFLDAHEYGCRFKAVAGTRML
jgi:hypothetical protein